MQHPDLAYTRRGSGPPLVLLHGIGHRRQVWDPILDELAQRYDVIAPDLSGFGESPAFAGGIDYSMPTAIAHLRSQFERWGVSKPHAVGNSLGGAIALELGARGVAMSVTALSPAGFFGPLSRFRALFALLALRTTALLSPPPVLRAITSSNLGRIVSGGLLYAHPSRQSATEAYSDALALKHATAFERTARQALTYRFDSQVPVPTTVAWAQKDRILAYSQAAIARQRLPLAQHVDLPDCGHVPVIDDPDLITRIIDGTIHRAMRQPRQHADGS